MGHIGIYPTAGAIGATGAVGATGPQGPAGGGTTGDISLTSFAAANNQATPANVTGLAFANGSIRSFFCWMSITTIATASTYTVQELYGVQIAGPDWSMTVFYFPLGDTTDVTLSITSAGQVQYTTPNIAGFVSCTIKFRAIITTV